MAGQYLQRNPTSTGNRKVHTWSGWVKQNRLNTAASNNIWYVASAGNSEWRILITNTGNLNVSDYIPSPQGIAMQVRTERLLRDHGSWFHLLVSVDTTQSTESERIKVYLDGVRVTEFSSTNYGSQNHETRSNTVGEVNYLGQNTAGGGTYQAYCELFDVFSVDGQALTPEVFGFYKDGNGYISAGTTQATDFRSGQWSPRSPKSIKYEINRRGGFGVNGFYLPMNDSSNPGADFHCAPNSIITLKGEDLPQPRNGAPTTTDAYVSQLRSDPYAANLVLAVPGITGGQGSGYGDYSADIKGSGSNKTVTANGNAGVAATASYYGSALSFDGSGDVLTLNNDTDFHLGSGDYTIECWINPNNFSGIYTIFALFENTPERAYNLELRTDGTPLWQWYETDGTSGANINPSVTLATGQWTHLAAERYGTNTTLYVNGVAAGTNTTAPLGIYSNTTEPFTIGALRFNSAYAQQFPGKIQDLRFYKGVAKYKGGFDVPKPYTPVGIESWRTVADVTANNFATLNYIDNNSGVLSNGSLTYGDAGSDGWNNSRATIGASSGKWYWEMRADAINQVICASVAGPSGNDSTNGASLGYLPGQTDDAGVTYYDDGKLYHADNQPSGSAWGAAYFEGDIIGIALDMDDSGGKVWFSRNGSWQGSGNPSTGANPARSDLKTHADTWFPISGTFFANTTQTFNFGQNPTFSNIAALNKNRINSSTADSVWHQSSNTGTHVDWTVSAGGTELDVAVPSGNYARIKLRSADGTIDLKKTYLLSFKYTTGPANLGIQNDQGYMTAVDGSVSPTGLSSGNFYSFVIHGTSEVSITGFTGSTYALANVIVSEIDECYTDDSGKGKFHYEPPTGFLALCEDNLPAPTVADPGEHFKTVLYTGDGNDGRSITGVGFQPDLVWIKNRDVGSWHVINDSVRGPNKALYSNETYGENQTPTNPVLQSLSSFDPDGFSLSADPDSNSNNGWNNSGNNLVAWCWKAGGAAVSNTDGTITSQVSVNQDAGFSIVSWTGNGTSGATVGHGLSKAPNFTIVKSRTNNTRPWAVESSAFTGRMLLNDSGQAGAFSHLKPYSDTILTLESGTTSNESGGNYIAYCWTEVENYSKVGTYFGNNSNDGPFVYCGFKPAFVLQRAINSTSDWTILDNTRSSTNPNRKLLYANLFNIEGDGIDDRNPDFLIDFLSNGFKVRATNNDLNNTEEYFFIAFAESPFQTANAK